jgi:hypothetical protein
MVGSGSIRPAFTGADIMVLRRLPVMMLRYPASYVRKSLFGRPAHQGSGVRQEGHLQERYRPQVRERPFHGQASWKRLDESGSLDLKRRLGRRPRLLWSGQVVVMDNLGAHERRRVKELIETRGRGLLDLPPYPPGLRRFSQRSRDFYARPGRVLGMFGGRDGCSAARGQRSQRS